MGKFEKTQYISVLNAVSAIAVVMLHTNGCFWNFSRERYWITANMIGSVLYFAVPVFFMISGATLIDYKKRYNTKTFFQKRIRKTVIPFIAWSFIGIIFCISKFGGNSIEISQVFPPNLHFIFSGILYTSIISFYWFFIPLFGIYLSLPLFASVEESEKKTVFIYLVILGFILNNLLPFLNTVFPIELYSGFCS